MGMAEFEEFTTLKFLLINLRWSGGTGFRTLEQRMEETVGNLPISSDVARDAFDLGQHARDCA